MLRALREHERMYKDSPYVFYNEATGGPFTVQMFHKIVMRAGAAARIPFPAHPHMLRHALVGEDLSQALRLPSSCSWKWVRGENDRDRAEGELCEQAAILSQPRGFHLH